MEITTLIKWNSLVYALYYGVNLAYDYFNTRKQDTNKPVQYTYKDLMEEAPVKVESTDNPTDQQAVYTGVAEEIKHQAHQLKTNSPVTLEGPVEDQGIPSGEFLQNARSFSSNINF